MSSPQVHVSAWADMLHPRNRIPPAPASPPPPLSPAAAALAQTSKVPEVFEVAFTGGPSRPGSIDPANLVAPQDAGGALRFGYIKIRSFSDGSTLGRADRIVTEFQRILELMDQVAPDGLILDIRRNPGGDVQAAERMLQMLTPGEIQPARFHLANTPAVVSILRKLAGLQRDQTGLSEPDKNKLIEAVAALGPWLKDAANAPLPRGRRVTSGQTLTDFTEANSIGQIYQGRVALLIDALTYSAAEVFASGFQDHAIGTVIGADLNSGGGGANVWTHDDLMGLLGPMTDLNLEPLPRGATMSLALRRYSRVGFFEGQWVEDVGIAADIPYVPRSAADILAGNPGILPLACGALADLLPCRVDITQFTVLRDGGVNLEVSTINIDSLRFFLDGRLVPGDQPVSRGENNSVTRQSVVVPALPENRDPARLRVWGLTLEKAQGGPELFLGAVRSVVLKKPEPEDSLLLKALGSNPGGLGDETAGS